MAGKLGALALVVVVLTAPTMACLLPTAAMTATEHECCKQMAEQCGKIGMPSSHSCCRRLASPDVSSFVVPHARPAADDFVTVAIAAAPTALQASVSPAPHHTWIDGIHGPPGSPPIKTSVLRI